jgi:hypothetical protein
MMQGQEAVPAYHTCRLDRRTSQPAPCLPRIQLEHRMPYLPPQIRPSARGSRSRSALPVPRTPPLAGWAPPSAAKDPVASLCRSCTSSGCAGATADRSYWCAGRAGPGPRRVRRHVGPVEAAGAADDSEVRGGHHASDRRLRTSHRPGAAASSHGIAAARSGRRYRRLGSPSTRRRRTVGPASGRRATSVGTALVTVGRQVHYWWPDDGWQRDTVARLCPRGASSESHDLHAADVGAEWHGGLSARRRLRFHARHLK